MDVLSDVLSWLRVEGTLSRRSEFTAPWGVRHPPQGLVSFMVVEKGRFFMLVDDAPRVDLESGDLLMLLPGGGMAMVDEPTTPAVPYAEVLAAYDAANAHRFAHDRRSFPTLRYGGGGRETVFRAWGLRFEGYEQHPLLPLLPRFIHVTYQQRSALPWLESTLRFLLHETHDQQDGSAMMTIRLVDLLFVQVLRAWVRAQPAEELGWLGALRDRTTRHALELMHEYPADPWTVDRLAHAVGMSRSTFSARFAKRVGMSPKKYLTRLRMNLAAKALRGDSDASLSQIAAGVGYDTESSFGRAFKRTFEVSPGTFRRRRLAGTVAG